MLVLNSFDLCTIRVYMSTLNDFVTWANTHEYYAPNTLEYDGQVTACDIIANAYADILLPDFKVKKVVLSTFVRDGQPYNPDSFVVFEYNLQGRRTRSGSESLDLNVCLTMNRRTDSGRNGRFLLRGVLTEAMVRSVGGVYEFTLPGGLDQNDFLAAEQQIRDLRVLANNLVMVMAPSTATNFNSPNVRLVGGISRGKIAFKRLKNR